MEPKMFFENLADGGSALLDFTNIKCILAERYVQAKQTTVHYELFLIRELLRF